MQRSAGGSSPPLQAEVCGIAGSFRYYRRKGRKSTLRDEISLVNREAEDNPGAYRSRDVPFSGKDFEAFMEFLVHALELPVGPKLSRLGVDATTIADSNCLLLWQADFHF